MMKFLRRLWFDRTPDDFWRLLAADALVVLAVLYLAGCDTTATYRNVVWVNADEAQYHADAYRCRAHSLAAAPLYGDSRLERACMRSAGWRRE